MESAKPTTTTATGIRLSNPAAPRLAGKAAHRRPNRRLKELRINRGLSPNQLGQACRPQVSGATIRNAEERGAVPHPITQFKIVNALNDYSEPGTDPLAVIEVFQPTSGVLA